MNNISPLRQRFLQDMHLAGLVPGPQEVYIRAVLHCEIYGKRCVCGHCLPDRQTKSGRKLMVEKLRVWFDAEADFIEVRFSDVAGYEKATENDAVMERVDLNGQIIGFSILGVSRFKKSHPLVADLVTA